MGNVNPRANQEGYVRGVSGASGIPTVTDSTSRPSPESASNTPAPLPVVPAPVAPTKKVVTEVAPTSSMSVRPVTPPSHTITNQNLVVTLGGSATGKTATWKKRMGGRNVATVTSVVSLGNSQRLKSHPIFTDANGVEHIAHDGKNFRKITDLNLNIVRRETVTRG